MSETGSTHHSHSRNCARSIVAAVAVSAMLFGVHVERAEAAGGGPTGCMAICPGWPAPSGGVCRPTSTVAVIAGSSIECGVYRVELTQGSLAVQDGSFTLNAKSLLVSNGQSITATCGAANRRGGFVVRVSEHVTVGTNGRMEASCSIGGGDVRLNADTAITIGGHGIKAKGQNGSDGGSIHLRTEGNVVVQEALEADSTGQGSGEGGEIDITGLDVTISQNLLAQGAGAGGVISVSASDDLTIGSSGKLDATGGGGEGGEVTLRADGDLYIDRRIEVLGAQASDGEGGLVSIAGDSVDIRNAIVASGGILGGQVHIESRGGKIDIGSQAASAFTIDVRRSSANPGDGGIIEIHSLGGDVLVGGVARLDASGSGSGAEGGTVSLMGASVTILSGADVSADSTTAGTGGIVRIESRDLTTVQGSVHASNGGAVNVSYRSTPPSPPLPGAVVDADPSLSVPCGDGVLRAGSAEQCDQADLGGATCQSVTGVSGVLDCTSTCLLDTAGCTGN